MESRAQLLKTAWHLVMRCFRGRFWKTSLVIALDTISGAARVGAVLLLSVMAGAMQNDGRVNVGPIELSLPTSLFYQGLLAAVLISAMLLVTSLSGYLAVWNARGLGRWLNEQAITDISAGLRRPLSDTLHVPLQDPDVFNRLLTQNAIHYGMMGEALIRFANPLALFVLAWFVILSQSIQLGIGVIVVVLAASPLFFKLFSQTRSVAQDFYAESATAMGGGVNRAVLELNAQAGVHTPRGGPSDIATAKYMSNFLDGLDRNILANERMGLLVGMIGAVVIAGVIVLNSYLLDRELISIPGMIALVGAFIYLFASGRTVSSVMTNLVRFYPQVLSILSFTEPKGSDADAVSKQGIQPELKLIPSEGQDALNLMPGDRVCVVTRHPLSRYTFKPIISPLAKSMGLEPVELSAHAIMASARYRFHADIALEDMLTDHGRLSLTDALAVADALGVKDELLSSNGEGLERIMSEALWSEFSGAARTGMRLIPLLADPTPRYLFIELDAIKNLNPAAFEPVFRNLKAGYVFIVSRTDECPPTLADQFAVINGGKITRVGDASICDGLEFVSDDGESLAQVDVSSTGLLL